MKTNYRLYQLSHTTWKCAYHVVWITKYRGSVMADNHIKQELRRIFKSIAKWKGFSIQAWYIGDEHIHLYLRIPPKYSVSYIIQILKAKSSSWLKKKNRRIPQGTYWARGYFVTTTGVDEEIVLNYVKTQSQHHTQHMRLFP